MALAPLQAFTAVVMGFGGVTFADVTNPAHRDTVLGVTMCSVAGGQLATVAWGGPIVNTLGGSAGWNFLPNHPVYVGEHGELTQTAPHIGWVLPVGFALSSCAIMLYPARAVPPSATLNAPIVSMLSFGPNLLIDTDTADVFDLTLTGNTAINMIGGIDGRIITLRVVQGTTGGHMIAFGPKIANDFPQSTGANSTATYQVQYKASTDQYIVIGYNYQPPVV